MHATHAASFWTQAYGIATIIAAFGGAIGTLAWLRKRVFRPLTDLFHVVLGGENEPNLRQRLAQQDVRVAQLHDELVGADGVKPRIDKLEEHVALIASHDRLQVDAALAAYTREQQRKQRRRGNG